MEQTLDRRVVLLRDLVPRQRLVHEVVADQLAVRHLVKLADAGILLRHPNQSAEPVVSDSTALGIELTLVFGDHPLSDRLRGGAGVEHLVLILEPGVLTDGLKNGGDRVRGGTADRRAKEEGLQAVEEVSHGGLRRQGGRTGHRRQGERRQLEVDRLDGAMAADQRILHIDQL